MALNSIGLGFIFQSKNLVTPDIFKIGKSFLSLEKQVERTMERTGVKLRDAQGRFIGYETKVTESSSRIRTGLKSLASGAIGAFAGFKAAQAGFRLAGGAAEFEQGIAAVKAVTRATRGEVDLLTKAAIDAGLKTQFSPDEAVQGLLNLATAGQTARDSTRTLIPVLDLAAGSLGQLGVGEAANAVVGTLNAYQISADKAGVVTDKLLRITQLTNFQARDFAGGLSKAAATGAVFGTRLDDVLVLMGQLRNANIDASSSSTSVREAVRRIGSDTSAQKALKSLGISAFDASGKARSAVDVLMDMVDATGKLSDEKRQALVYDVLGARGLLSFNAIQQATFKTTRDGREVTLRGRDAIAALRGEMAKSQGTAAGFRKELLGTFKGQMGILRGVLQSLGVAVGRPFAEVLRPVVSAAAAAVEWLTRAFLNLPAPVQKAVAIVVTLGGAVVAATGAMIAMRGAALLLGPSLRAMAASALPMLLPFIKVIAVVAAVAAAIALLKTAYDKNIGGFGDAMRDAWADLRPALGELKTAFGTLLSAVGAALRPMLPIIKAIIKFGLKVMIWHVRWLALAVRVTAAIITVAVRAIAFVLNVLAAEIRWIAEKGGQAFNTMAAAVKTAWNVVADVLSPIFDWIVGKIEWFIGKAEWALKKAEDFSSLFFGDVVGGARGAISSQIAARGVVEALAPGAGLSVARPAAAPAASVDLMAPIMVPPRAAPPPRGGPSKVQVSSKLMLDGRQIAEHMKEIDLEDRARRSD